MSENGRIELWPQELPGGSAAGSATGGAGEERPYLELHLPALPPPGDAPEGGLRTAVIVCPGGGYARRAPHEGAPVAEWLNSIGVAAFVLHYRVAPSRHPAPLLDAQRALRIVRHRAAEWSIDPEDIGILGFSAGGHLAATASTHWDLGQPGAPDPVERVSCRPDFTILCYPVISLIEPFAHAGSRKNLLGDSPDPSLCRDLSNETQVRPDTPPAFLWHTADDAGVPVENSLAYAAALRRHGVPFSLHVFPSGRHGLGLAQDHPEVSQWPALCARWLKQRRARRAGDPTA